MGSLNLQDVWRKFWFDEDGQRVIYQPPNAPLIVWFILFAAAKFISNSTFQIIAGTLASFILIYWSLLEIFKGVNYFRKSLGLAILLITVFSLASKWA